MSAMKTFELLAVYRHFRTTVYRLLDRDEGLRQKLNQMVHAAHTRAIVDENKATILVETVPI